MARRGFLALILALCICLTSILPAYASFSDVKDPWLSSIVDDLAGKNIVNGFTDGSFRPANPVTRAQMAKLIAIAQNYPLTSAAAESMSFSDCSSQFWATSYIKASAAAGIVKGYPDGTFRPESQITRGELARMLRRASGIATITPAAQTFKDTSSSYWAYSDIETMVKYKIMGGYSDGTFRPAQPATRAQIAVSLYKLLNANLQPVVQETPPVAPAGDTTTSPRPSPADDGRIIIAVDPGHGGTDPGAVAKSNGLKEKDVNLAVALKLQSLLKSAGFEVVMTRSTDVFVDLYQRAYIANGANADVFISIHHNANATETTDGTAVYSYPGAANGAALARLIQDELIKAFGWDGVAGKDDGTKTANFVVLRETLMTAVLTESAYLSNPTEAALLATEDFRQKEAQAIFNGIVKFLHR